ncbi:MAG: SIS domain-containing protein [Candidatus Latescibacteria bacterium]|nr:SIS domain-containing protein [Candidatus Latescibacterota bacterium]NIM21132.1 SIS domain-containing protein [Candidatus Latescibacterota bacterium]NIM65267.1 SIS domain-containing protein [Candidatus Latescibacterota bacterium]NIO01782.1 SIS domain-containing protein [Candidatus Latescibacterota bacterium]NIO28299.1 SIS domain-containing protein [Candidatus Latescibacterota bacterium]
MTLVEISQALMDCFEKGGSVFACGNGGSATQAAHFAAELVGRYNKMDKRSLPAFALGENSAIVTALSNDYTFSDVFARQLEGLGKQGDCLIALSTSGNSENVLRACRVAKKKGMRVFAFTGRGGGQVAQLCEALLMFPENDTPRIQEAHLIALHTICQLIERKLLSQERQTSAAAARGERS